MSSVGSTPAQKFERHIKKRYAFTKKIECLDTRQPFPNDTEMENYTNMMLRNRIHMAGGSDNISEQTAENAKAEKKQEKQRFSSKFVENPDPSDNDYMVAIRRDY